MKLKSLLLGSAAALALSTGAQAADPIVDFVSLDVCDAYGISGLTISSDDTCLKISGYVDYEFEAVEFNDEFETISDVEWRVIFDAATQTDAGMARAYVRLREMSTSNNQVRADRAYVQFGDSTVLTAGRAGSIFDTILLNRSYGWVNFDELDKGDLRVGGLPGGGVATGGDSIQIEALVADGFTVLAALEDLQNNGTAGLGVAYDNAGISAEAGVLFGGLFEGEELLNYYARIQAEFDAFVVRGGFVANDEDDWIASLGASATFDMFTIDVDGAFAEGDEYFVGAQGSFAATDIVDVYLGAAYAEGLLGRDSAEPTYLSVVDGGFFDGELFTVYGGVNVAATENISVNAEVGYVEFTEAGDSTDLVYGVAGVSYAPGGGFTSALTGYLDTEDNYSVKFNARKSF